MCQVRLQLSHTTRQDCFASQLGYKPLCDKRTCVIPTARNEPLDSSIGIIVRSRFERCPKPRTIAVYFRRNARLLPQRRRDAAFPERRSGRNAHGSDCRTLCAPCEAASLKRRRVRAATRSNPYHDGTDNGRRERQGLARSPIRSRTRPWPERNIPGRFRAAPGQPALAFRFPAFWPEEFCRLDSDDAFVPAERSPRQLIDLVSAQACHRAQEKDLVLLGMCGRQFLASAFEQRRDVETLR
jgi:hypothetical protein